MDKEGIKYSHGGRMNAGRVINQWNRHQYQHSIKTEGLQKKPLTRGLKTSLLSLFASHFIHLVLVDPTPAACSAGGKHRPNYP